TRGRCQPPFSDQQMSTMWSVKTVPKPGSSSSSARCAEVLAARFFVTWNARRAGEEASVEAVVLMCVSCLRGGAREKSSVSETSRDGVADLRGRPRIRAAGGDVVLDRARDARGLRGQPEVIEQEGDRPDGRGRIGFLLARDVGRRTVHGLEHRGEFARRVQVPRGGEADAAGDRSGEVGEDVSEEV